MGDVAADTMAIIARQVPNGPSTVQLDDRLEDLGLDSLGIVELVFAIEEKFDITIPYNANSEQPDLETVGDVVRAVQTLVDGKA